MAPNDVPCEAHLIQVAQLQDAQELLHEFGEPPPCPEHNQQQQRQQVQGRLVQLPGLAAAWAVASVLPQP